jgi:hypothetical protein
MNAKNEEQLIADVDALKKAMAAQMPHTILLLALARAEYHLNRSNIEAAIQSLPFGDSSEANEQKKQACELLRRYFPKLYIPA